MTAACQTITDSAIASAGATSSLRSAPSHWRIVELGRIGRLFKGNGGTKEDEVEDGVPCIRYGDLYTQYQHFAKGTRARVTEERAAKYTRIRYGDILFAASGETLDEIGKSVVNLMREPACCGGDIILLRPSNEIDARFMGYATGSSGAQAQKSQMGRGMTVMHIYGSDLKHLRLALPPPDEQRAIANFLDSETEKIDPLIGKKRRLIELLEERQRALISHAVTKGLNPDAPMKDSGVEWLGQVPRHWALPKIKWVSPVLRGASPRPIDDPKYFDEEGEYGWVRISDVSRSHGVLEKTEQRLSELGSSLSAPLDPGALFLSIAGSVGKPCITSIRCCIHDGFVYFPRAGGLQQFMYWVFVSSEPFRGLGKMGTQLNLNTDTVGDIYIALPSENERTAIVRHLERVARQANEAIDQCSSAICLLEEYRSALITAAVTGQIDVRDKGL